jgi:hypothetical protein
MFVMVKCGVLFQVWTEVIEFVVFCLFVQVTEVHQIIQVLSKRSEDVVHSDRRPQEVANIIAEANTVILVCIPTAALLNLVTVFSMEQLS